MADDGHWQSAISLVDCLRLQGPQVGADGDGGSSSTIHLGMEDLSSLIPFFLSISVAASIPLQYAP